MPTLDEEVRDSMAEEEWKDRCREFDAGLCHNNKLADIQQQLTAALAERDEARERVKRLEGEVEQGHAWTENKVWLSQEDYTKRLDTAWQQGAEAFREAVKKALVLLPINADYLDQAIEITRALPVPERKEG